jgi:hypothetical protein
MRTVFVFIVIGCSTWTFGQKSDNNAFTPFQVVFSDSCINKIGNPVKNFELLSVDEVIHVKGQISLIHETGIPIEFGKDTIIQLRWLHEKITPPTIPKNKKSKNTGYVVTRPKIERLLLTEGKQALDLAYGLCSDCHYEIKIICPYVVNNKIFVAGDLDIMWQSIEQDSFKIELKTIFDDEVLSSIILGTELHLDSATINRLLDKEGYLDLTIRTVEKSMYLGGALISKYPFPGQIEFNCDTKSAPIALLIGYFLEMKGKPLRDKAESYYKLATSLSKDSFFKDMLDNFYKRKSFYK